MKRFKIGALLKCTLAVLMSFSCFSILMNNHDVLASENFSITEKITYGADKKSASIVLDTTSIKSMYKIVDIKAHDKTQLDSDNPVFSVRANGVYTFAITYQEIKTNPEDEVENQEYTKEVKIDGIVSDTENGGSVAIAPSLRNTVIDGGVSMTIKNGDGTDWDPSLGWNNDEVKDVSVMVDYGDNTTDNKKLAITLPEGMKYRALTVKEGTDVSGITGPAFVSTYSAGDTTGDSIQSMTIPSTDVATTMATFGTVNYNIQAGVKEVTISFKASVDPARHYGPHILKNKINVLATKNAANSLVGTVSQSISAIGDAKGAAGVTILGGTSGQTLPGAVYKTNFYSLYTVANNIPRLGAKSIKFKYYYIPDMGFNGIVSTSGDWSIVATNEAENSVTYERTNALPAISGGIVFSYMIPEGKAAGVYAAPKKPSVVYTWYDDSTTTLETPASLNPEQVEVVGSYLNKMDMLSVSNVKMDANIPEAMTMGPYLVVKNKQPGIIRNQVFEVAIEKEYKVSRIQIPFQGAEGTKVTNIKFKTNKRDWTNFSGEALAYTSTIVYVTRNSLGISDPDEYITGFSANVGAFQKAYAPASSEKYKVSAIGTIEPTKSANVTYSMYDQANKAATIWSATGAVSAVGPTVGERTIASAARTYFHNSLNQQVDSVRAGDTYKINAMIRPSLDGGISTGVQAVLNPEIYIREPIGQTFLKNSIKAVDQDGKEVILYSVGEPTINNQNEKIYRYTTTNMTIGSYFSENLINNTITVTYNMATSVQAKGTFSTNGMIGWGKAGTTVKSAGSGLTIDVHDLNGNGETTDRVMGSGLIASVSTLIISENKTVLVDTYLTQADDDVQKPAYVEGEVDSISYLTSESEVDYNVAITNNNDNAATSFVTYLPIPKTGTNFGSEFQSEDFKWDMALSKAFTLDVGLVGKYQVLYSTDATATNYDTTANFLPTIPTDLNHVKMVKIVALTPILSQESARIKIPLKVGESVTTAIEDNKVKTMNIYKPRYKAAGIGFDADLSGTMVGAQLVLAEVQGMAFIDKDSNGVYTAAKDSLIKDHEVKLHKWDTGLNAYIPAVESDNVRPIVTKTKADGTYTFSYAQLDSSGKYAVEFAPAAFAEYAYTSFIPNVTNNCSVITEDDIPNLGDTYKGWVLDIEPIGPSAQNINVGYTNYTPPAELKVSLPSVKQEVKVGESITITPTLMDGNLAAWNDIKAAVNPIQYELVAPLPTGVVSQNTTNTDGSLTISQITLAKGTQNLHIKATIYDKHGRSKESNVTVVSVISATLPTIIMDDVTTYVGENVSTMISAFSAEDNMGDTIIPIFTGPNVNTTITTNTPLEGVRFKTPGTYSETIKIKDKHGNETSKTFLVKVNGLPVAQSSAQTYKVSDIDIAGQVLAAGSGTYKLAPAGAGSAIDAPLVASYVITDGPSTVEFSKVGIYDVTYTVATPEGKKATKAVNIEVTEDTAQSSQNFTINAFGFVMEYEDAKNLTQTTAVHVTHGKATASKIVGTTISDVSENIVVDTTQLEAIKNVGFNGGLFDLTFKVEEAGESASITIQVYVKPIGSTENSDQTIIVNANAFVLMNADAASLDKASALNKAAGSAVRIHKNAQGNIVCIDDITNDIVVDDSELQAIKVVGAKGDVLPLTFGIADAVVPVSTTIQIRIMAVGSVVDNTKTLEINASGFDVAYTDLKLFDADIAKIQSKTSAFKYERNPISNEIMEYTDVSSKISVNQNQLEAIKEASMSGGLFDLTFTIVDGVANASKTVKVLVTPAGLPPVTLNDYTLSAQPFELKHLEAEAMDEEKAINLANVNAMKKMVDEGESVTEYVDVTDEVTIDQTQLAAIQTAGSEGGIFKLSFYIDVEGVQLTQEVDVLVKARNSVVDETQTIALSASGFVIENYTEAQDLNLSELLVKSKALALKTIRDELGNVLAYEEITNNITADSNQLLAIQSADEQGGIYMLKLTIEEDGIIVDKEILVVVVGSTISQPENGIVIYAKDANITYAEAKVMDKASLLVKTNAIAYLIESGEELEVDVDAGHLSNLKQTAQTGGICELTLSASDDNIKTRSVRSHSLTVKINVDKDPNYDETIKKTSKASTSENNVSTGDESNVLSLLTMLMGTFVLMVRKIKSENK